MDILRKKSCNRGLLLWVLMAWSLVACNQFARAQALNKVAFAPRSSAVVADPYKSVLNYNLRGDFVMIGNSNVFLNPYTDGGNNSGDMKFSNLDPTNATIKNSSSSRLALPIPNNVDAPCTKIIYAGLYWAGRGDDTSSDVLVKAGNAGNGLNKKKIQFKAPGMANYVELTTDKIYYGGSDVYGMYSSYVDVTTYVKAGGVGDYFVGNIATFQGTGGDIGYYGGWGMVVIYENPTMKWRDITVFDGFSQIAWDGTTQGLSRVTTYGNLAVSGFRAAQSGAINIKMGMMAGEGDRDISGDSFDIRKLATNTWQTLSHTQNTANNFFNSSIFTGGNARNPNNLNNYGIDIAMFDLPNTGNVLIGNNQTQTAFRFGTTQDVYSIFNITFAVDAYVPEMDALNTRTDAGAASDNVVPGQELEFTISLKNKGSEPIINGKIEIPIPPNMHYVSASATPAVGTVTWSHPSSTDPVLTPGGKIVWDLTGVEIPNNNLVYSTLKYKLRVTTNCALLQTSSSDCALKSEVNGSFTGLGKNSLKPLDLKFIKGYITGANCVGQPIYDPYNINVVPSEAFLANCVSVAQVTDPMTFNYFCSVPNNAIDRAVVASKYPAGTTFYKSQTDGLINPANLVSGNFSVVAGTNSFYAVVYGMKPGCYVKFNINLTSVTTIPTAANVTACFGAAYNLDVALSAVGVTNQFELYYFATSTSTTPLTTIPHPTAVGVYTYYVAEGKMVNAQLCVGNKIAFTVTILAGPTGTLPQVAYSICDDAVQMIELQTTAAQITWQIMVGNVWQDISTANWSGVFTVNGNQISIGIGYANVSTAKIRAVMKSNAGCETISQEVTLTFKGCKLPTNPMIPSKFIIRI